MFSVKFGNKKFVYIKRIGYQHYYCHEKGLIYTGTTYARKLLANISKININLR